VNGAAVPDEALLAYDFLGIMSYDQCGPWSDASEHSTYDAAVQELAYWVDDRGYPAENTVPGVPFYGYCWGATCPGEYISYADIVETWPEWADRDWVEDADLALSFNGPTTIGRKAELARGYGGAMIGELTQDAYGDASLLDVLVR
jgi:GH18 family chitinase